MLKWIVAAVAVASLAGCATPTPYQPRVPGAHVGGYSEQRLGAGAWRVRFSGNTATSRGRVERSLLYRAAELTLLQGGEWFEELGSNTEARSRYYAAHDPFYEQGEGRDYAWGWRPQWTFSGPRSGWRTWDPLRDRDIWSEDGANQKVWETHRYIATAEILIGSGPRPAGRSVFDARQTMAQLAPTVVGPPPH